MISLIGDDCPREWIEFLDFHQKTMEFKAGAVIIQQGDPVSGIFSIRHGKVKVVMDDHGEERLIRLAANGDILGHRGLGGDGHYPISSLALVPTTVTFLPLSVFHIVARTNAAFVHRLMMFFANELRQAEQLQLQMPVLNRVARSLMMNYDAFGLEPDTGQLTYTISRKEIASHATTTYESVIRSLADLAKRKVIRLDGKAIAILDPQTLGRLATDPNAL